MIILGPIIGFVLLVLLILVLAERVRKGRKVASNVISREALESKEPGVISKEALEEIPGRKIQMS